MWSDGIVLGVRRRMREAVLPFGKSISVSLHAPRRFTTVADMHGWPQLGRSFFNTHKKPFFKLLDSL